MMILDKVLPTVQDALKAIAVQQRGNIPRPMTRPEGQAVLPLNQPPLSDIPLTGFESIADKLRAYLPTFLSAASGNSDPNILVELTAPNIPPKDKQIVIEWLESEKYFSDLCTLHPIIAGQRAWWEEYNQGLLAILKNPGETEPEHDETE